MKAVMKVSRGMGNVALRDIPEPSPGAHQVLVEVGAAGICGTDLHIYHDEFKSDPPVVLGHELSGRIVEVGAEVDASLLGSRVTTEIYFSTCGVCRYCRSGAPNLCLSRRSIGSAVNGGFARYVVVPAANIHVLPDTVDLAAGALSEPLACVVHGVLSTPTARPGDLAVIAGPGATGLLTLQVVKAAGATVAVLGTDADEARLELARSLGADYTFNVNDETFSETLCSLTYGSYGADVVYECSGAGQAAQQLLSLVRRGGRYVQIGLFGRPVSWDADLIPYKELLITGSNASTPASWLRALTLLAEGKVITAPLISHRYPLEGWATAFSVFEQRQGVKLVLLPGTELA